MIFVFNYRWTNVTHQQPSHCCRNPGSNFVVLKLTIKSLTTRTVKYSFENSLKGKVRRERFKAKRKVQVLNTVKKYLFTVITLFFTLTGRSTIIITQLKRSLLAQQALLLLLLDKRTKHFRFECIYVMIRSDTKSFLQVLKSKIQVLKSKIWQ